MILLRIWVLKVRIDYLAIIMNNIKSIYYHYKGEKRKNNGISGGIVIRLIAIMERFSPKFRATISDI